jgi:hypothetical protein
MRGRTAITMLVLVVVGVLVAVGIAKWFRWI